MAPSGPLLVVDGGDDSRRQLVALLERIGLDPLPAPSGEDALASLDGAPPLLALIEVELPGMSGYQLCRELHEAYGETFPVIFYSAERTGSTDRVAGLLLGADDYVVKPFEDDELLARVRRSLRRWHTEHAPAAAPGEWAAALSPRELEVLRLLAEGLGQRQIAARLVISPKTVATHIQRVLEKLGVHSRAQAVAMAHRHGLMGA